MARNKNIHFYDINSVFTEFDKYLESSEFNKLIELSDSETLDNEYIRLVDKFSEQLSINIHTKDREDFIKLVKEKLFDAFLIENEISMVHRDKLFSAYNGTTILSSEINDFKTRRHKPKTRFFVKKILAPIAITAGAVAGTVAAVSLSGLTAGSSIGFIPVFTSLANTATAIASFGLTATIVATPPVIGIKNIIIKAHYNHKYETANENFKRLYLEQTILENLPITDLMNHITETNHKIADSKNPIAKFFMRMKNKNRIKHLAKTTQDLMSMYSYNEKCEDLLPEQRASKLNCLHDILSSVDKFIVNDVRESEARSILTAKRKKNKEILPSTIDNIDLYADLQITIKRNSLDIPESEKPKKHSKFTVNHLRDQHNEAKSIISDGKTFIQRLISKWRVDQVEAKDENNNPILDNSGNAITKPKLVKETI